MFEPGIFRPLVDGLLKGGDPYMVLADLPSFARAQDRADELYASPGAWDEKAVLNVARSGKFSSDRTVQEYAREIWGIVPCPIEGTGSTD